MARTKSQIKSKKRVSDFGEVFTAEREVKAMCDLIPNDVWENIESTFLEPSCGNGNFLVEILARKYGYCESAADGLKALNSIMAIDIQSDNCQESRERLLNQFVSHFPNATEEVKSKAETILQKNIICGDSLKIMEEWRKENEYGHEGDFTEEVRTNCKRESHRGTIKSKTEH